jgi:hypothetical protein
MKQFKKKKTKEYCGAQENNHKMNLNISISSTFNYPGNSNSKFIHVLQTPLELNSTDKYELAVTNIHYSEIFQKICSIECFGISKLEIQNIKTDLFLAEKFTQLINNITNENLEHNLDTLKAIIKELFNSLIEINDINTKYFILKNFYFKKLKPFVNIQLLKNIKLNKIVDKLNNILNAFEIKMKDCVKLINKNKFGEYVLKLKNKIYICDNESDFAIVENKEYIKLIFDINVFFFNINDINPNVEFDINFNNNIKNFGQLECKFFVNKLIHANHIYMHCNLIKNTNIFKCKQVIKSFKYNSNNYDLECNNLEYFEVIFNYITQLEISFTDQNYNLIEFENPTYINFNFRKQKCRFI